MPARDGSGPSGKGARSGRGMGNCAPRDIVPSLNNAQTGNTPASWGRWFWRKTFGRAFGRRGSQGRNFR